ncbi:MAG: hypothetical protein M3N14_06980 [Bacteroidota bacterium]|nr:hypothetical protein [Bacteroidota bacterium]
MLVPLNGRGGLVTFVATKVTKSAFSRNDSLLHRPLPCKSGKTGAVPYVRDYALQRTWATIVLPDFSRSLSAEGEKAHHAEFISQLSGEKNSA